MTTTKLKAYEFAQKKHAGQKDDTGRDYFQAHVLNVVTILYQCGNEVTDDMIVAAYLHDTLEDTKTTYDELVAEFGQHVADIVKAVTHDGKPDEKGYYFPNLIPDLAHKEACIVKIADRLSNLTRMGGWDANRQEHYLRKSKFWKTE